MLRVLSLCYFVIEEIPEGVSGIQTSCASLVAGSGLEGSASA